MIDLECLDLDLDRDYEHRVIAQRLVPAAQGAVAVCR